MFRLRNRRAVGAVVAIAGIFTVQPAFSADLTGPEIQKLLSGTTIYLEFATDNPVTGGGGGVMAYTTDGKVSTKFPNGSSLKGTWVVKDNTSCITWDGQPPAPCTRFDKTGEVITSINTASGKPRGKITKTAPGNPEKLGWCHRPLLGVRVGQGFCRNRKAETGPGEGAQIFFAGLGRRAGPAQRAETLSFDEAAGLSEFVEIAGDGPLDRVLGNSFGAQPLDDPISCQAFAGQRGCTGFGKLGVIEEAQVQQAGNGCIDQGDHCGLQRAHGEPAFRTAFQGLTHHRHAGGAP